MPEPVQESPIRRLIAAIRKRVSASNVDEAAGAGKEAAGVVAEQLPEGIIPHKALEAQRKRQAMLDQIGRE